MDNTDNITLCLELFHFFPDAYCFVSLYPNQRVVNNARQLHRQDYRSALLCTGGLNIMWLTLHTDTWPNYWHALASHYATEVLTSGSPQDDSPITIRIESVPWHQAHYWRQRRYLILVSE